LEAERLAEKKKMEDNKRASTSMILTDLFPKVARMEDETQSATVKTYPLFGNIL
jgi:hypothetical protein